MKARMLLGMKLIKNPCKTVTVYSDNDKDEYSSSDSNIVMMITTHGEADSNDDILAFTHGEKLRGQL